MEIERRFLIRNKNKVNELIEEFKDSKKAIVQDYIFSDIFTAIRKRKIEKNGQVKYVYTVKTGKSNLSVNEYESEITKEQYDKLEKDEGRITIEKDRYFIPYIENLIIELDVFHGAYEGIIFAEIEYETEKQAYDVKVPDWFDVEIGEKVSNDMMSRELIDFEKIIRRHSNNFSGFSVCNPIPYSFTRHIITSF